MKYCASKKYKIVCKETCYHVKNIKAQNLVTYDTLRDAIVDGCRPCKHCISTAEYLVGSIANVSKVILEGEFDFR